MESSKGKIVFKEIKGKILEKVNSFACLLVDQMSACDRVPAFVSVQIAIQTKLSMSSKSCCLAEVLFMLSKLLLSDTHTHTHTHTHSTLM